MIKDFFIELANDENGKFYFQDQTIAIGGGVRSPELTCKVIFSYKSNKFELIHRTGTAFVGSINCSFRPVLKPISFKIISDSHFKVLFRKDKKRLKVISESSRIKDFLRDNDSLNCLNEIAKKENFSPTILCDNFITTEYSLSFENWEQVVNPIIELYKNLIDEFER